MPFLTLNVTILRRMGYYDHWTLFNTLTEAKVLSWTNAGAGTVADIKATAAEAFVCHHAEADLLGQVRVDLAAVA